MRKTFLLLTAAMLLLTTANAKIKVHTIGDSTMADYDENTTDKRGWCQYLQSFFDTDSITINNRGKSGADTRQFYNNNWPSVKSQMAAGDYLLIQFAHNDEGTVTYGTDNLELAAYNAANGLPALTDARGTCPYSTYRDMLRLYIDEARALGVNPILVGPICRKYFNGNTIKRNGQHDLGDNFWKLENGQLLKNQSIPTSDHTMDYVEAMRIVAQEKNVPFINLTEATKNLYLQLGEATCTSTLFCNGDNTHLKAGGAIQVGRLGAQMLKDSIPALASFITIPTSLTISPTQISIGETYSGIMQQKEVLLSGSGLTPEIGTITATASANLSLSIDGETYSPSLSLSYSGGTLFQRVKVQASYAAAGLQTDSIVFVCGDQQTVVTINAMVISLDGGMNVSANWTIADKTTLTDVLTEGPISAVMTLHNMVATDSKAEFTNGSESTISMVRIHNADANGAKAEWPANEIDENVSRYIDFAITAPAEAQLRIVRISMDMAAHSSNFICLHVNIGMNDNMEGVVTIAEKKNLTNKQIYSEVWTPTITVPAGQTLHVRILPWHEYSEAKSGKYIALSNVVIEGVVFEESSETNILTPQEHISVEKRMVNGQLLIIKDGVAYTILCERIPLPANL